MSSAAVVACGAVRLSIVILRHQMHPVVRRRSASLPMRCCAG